MASLNEKLDLPESGAETLPFLENEEKTESEVGEGAKEPVLRQFAQIGIRAHCIKYGIIHVFIFLIYTVLFIISTTRKTDCMQNTGWYSPAQEAEQYELRPVDGLAEGSVYAGYPSPESDAAWAALLEGPEPIHQFKRVRRWLYQPYYYPNQTELEYNERMTHAEHCLEVIRQAAMCHGDTTITSFKWLHDAQGRVIEPTTKDGALHRCVKWDRLSDWTKSRRVDLYDRELLIKDDEVDSAKE